MDDGARNDEDKPAENLLRRRSYEKPALHEHGTILDLTLGQVEGQLEPGGLFPNFFASYGAA